jgi:galacturonokinase
VRAGIDAWQMRDWKQLGALMNDSCNSSKHNYECGCAQLDTLHGILSSTPGVLGARWSGAGFGGCEVALVDRVAFTAAHAASIRERYLATYPELECKIFICDRYNVCCGERCSMLLS